MIDLIQLDSKLTLHFPSNFSMNLRILRICMLGPKILETETNFRDLYLFQTELASVCVLQYQYQYQYRGSVLGGGVLVLWVVLVLILYWYWNCLLPMHEFYFWHTIKKCDAQIRNNILSLTLEERVARLLRFFLTCAHPKYVKMT